MSAFIAMIVPAAQEMARLARQRRGTTQMTTKIDSTSDERVVNNVMRHEYRVLTDAEKTQMQNIKDEGLKFWQMVASLSPAPCRETSLAQTKIEEAVMWAVKAITK
jgi:hypothetical protein